MLSLLVASPLILSESLVGITKYEITRYLIVAILLEIESFIKKSYITAATR